MTTLLPITFVALYVAGIACAVAVLIVFANRVRRP